MTVDEMIAIVAECTFPDYQFNVWEDSRGAVYLQGSYQEPDTITNKWEVQKTRRWLLSPHMTKSEIVGTCFKCLMTSQEHKAREWFKWRGKAIYQPHHDVDDLWRVCDRVDTRESREESKALVEPALQEVQEGLTHRRSCKCNGTGMIRVPDGNYCNCGSGEGCSMHSPMWMKEAPCDEQAMS